ncbi:MAG: hypothetical protein RL351_21 [Actinomycetota bacterium]
MKRPQSKPVARTSSGLPSAPARVANNSAKPAKRIQSVKQVKAAPRKLGKPTKAGKSKKQNRFSLTAEAKRFTQATRNRRIVVGTSLSAFGALLLLVLATIFTPLLAVEKIEVTGITRLKEKSIVNALVSQMGKPLPTINSADVAKSLESFPLIESFSIISLPPHTLRIEIAERQPIGVILISGTSYLYDPAGVRIGISNGSEDLPLIAIEGTPEKSKQFKAAIDVLMALPADLLQRVAEINAKSKDDVTMRLRGYAGQKIIWGDGTDSVLKSRVLDALISNQKKTDRVTYDVSSPNAPVVRYGNF